MAYGAVDRRTWNDERFRRWDRDTRDLWLYLLTCPHGNRIGCFVLDPLYAAADLQIEPEAVRESLQELHREDRIVWDPDARVVCIRNHLHPDYNPLANESVVKAAVKDLQNLPDSLAAFEALLEAVKQWGRPHYEQLEQALRHRVDDCVGHRAGHDPGQGVPHLDHEQEQDQEHDSTEGSLPNGRSPSEPPAGDPPVENISFEDLSTTAVVDLIDDGAFEDENWRSWIAPLIRAVAFTDGPPPVADGNWSVRREMSVAKELIGKGYTPEQVGKGYCWGRFYIEAGQLPDVEPGESFSMRRLLTTTEYDPKVPLVMAQDYWRKKRAELEEEGRRGRLEPAAV